MELVTVFDRAPSRLLTDLLLDLLAECEVQRDRKVKCLQLGRTIIPH